MVKLPSPGQWLRTGQVCNRDAPAQTGSFPSSVETAKERDRRSVSTRPYRRLIPSWSCYSGVVDFLSLSFTCNHDLSFSLPVPNHLAKFPAVSILYRYIIVSYGYFVGILGYFVDICCLLPHPYSTQSQYLSCRQNASDARQECQCRRSVSAVSVYATYATCATLEMAGAAGAGLKKSSIHQISLSLRMTLSLEPVLHLKRRPLAQAR